MKSDLSTLDELNRREFIASAAKACLGVGLMPMAGSFVHNSVSALEPGSRPASARYVIYLNMTGAMSHLDTFGTNPEAPDIQGPTKSIRTSADGVILSENLPLTAKHMHNAAVIRTMVTSQGAHEQASYLMHTSYLKRGNHCPPHLWQLGFQIVREHQHNHSIECSNRGKPGRSRISRVQVRPPSHWESRRRDWPTARQPIISIKLVSEAGSQWHKR